MPRFARDTQKQSPRNTQLRNRQLSNLEQRENQVDFPINVAHSVVDCCTARSPQMRHPYDFGAFQRNATQGMGIAGDHDPTAHQLRKQIHARSARQVAGSSQSVEDRLSRTEMFTDSKRETQLRSNGALHPKPMNYEHEMHFVHLQDILFSQTDINLKEKPTTINQIKCHTSKIKLVFTPSHAGFDVFIIGFFGKEEEMEEGQTYAPAPQIPLMEVIGGDMVEQYISINNRRLHAIHSLLYALSRDYDDIKKDRTSSYTPNNGVSIMRSIERFRGRLRDLYQIEVSNIFCPVIIHNPLQNCPSYLNDNEQITWRQLLRNRFRNQRGCCDPKVFDASKSCPEGKKTSCDSGIDRIPTFSHMIGEIYNHPKREPDEGTHESNGSRIITLRVIEGNYYEFITRLLDIRSSNLFTDDVVIIPEGAYHDLSVDLYAKLSLFQRNARCYQDTTLTIDPEVSPSKQRRRDSKAQKKLKQSNIHLKLAIQRRDKEGIKHHEAQVKIWSEAVAKEAVVASETKPTLPANTPPMRTSKRSTRALSDDQSQKTSISKRTAINPTNRKETRALNRASTA